MKPPFTRKSILFFSEGKRLLISLPISLSNAVKILVQLSILIMVLIKNELLLLHLCLCIDGWQCGHPVFFSLS